MNPFSILTRAPLTPSRVPLLLREKPPLADLLLLQHYNRKIIILISIRLSVTVKQWAAPVDEIVRGTAPTGEFSMPNSYNPVSGIASNDQTSDILDQGDCNQPHLGWLSRHLLQVIYTKHHFEDLKVRVIEYTKDMIRKHEELGITIIRRDIVSHWRRQVC